MPTHASISGLNAQTLELLPRQFQREVVHLVKALLVGEGREGFALDELWVFGSWARGEASWRSDVDLLALVADSATHYNLNVQAVELIAQSPAVLPYDILVLRKSEWEREQDNICTAYPDIKQDRKLLYARQH
jgi:predicted nucleotidyltransferase